MLLCAPACVSAQTSAWITPDQWPHRLEVAPADAARLLVMEERGTNLRLLFDDGARAWVPERRHTGIELLLVPAGASAALSLEPRYANSPATSVRVTAHTLSSVAEQEAARTLTDAGRLAGAGTLDELQQACIAYEEVAAGEGLPPAWTNTAKLLAVGCNSAAGRQNSQEQLDQLNDAGATLGLFPYHAEWLRGRNHYVNGEYERAQRHYERGLALLEALTLADEPDRRGVEQDRADLLNDLAIIFVIRAFSATGADRAAFLARGRAMLDEAMALATRHQDHLVRANVYNYIAQMGNVESDDKARIENLLLAKQEAELLDDPDELIFFLGSIGDYYADRGQFRRALEAYLEVNRILETSTWLGRSGDAFENISYVYHQLGDLPRAKALTERAIELYAANNNEYRTTILYYHLGTIVEEQGDLTTARSLMERHLAYARTSEVPWDPFRMRTQAALSRIEAKLGNQARALQLSSEIFEYSEVLERANSLQATPVYTNHASLLLNSGDAAGALTLLGYALENIATQPSDKVDIMTGQLAAYQQLGQTEDAIATAQRVFALIESQQTQLESARLGPYWSGKTHAVYMTHADYLLEHREEDPTFRELAFAATERARAASLRLRRQELLLAATENDPAAEQEWQQLMQEARSGFSANESDADALALERRIGEARERYFSAYGDARGSVQLEPPSLAAMMESIPADTLLLEFVSGPANVWRYELSNTGWSVTRLGTTRELRTLVDAALYELQQANRRRDNLQQLSDLLLADLPLTDAQTQLLVSPSAELNSVPFAALMYEGDYLGARAGLTLVPSSSEYFARQIVATKIHSREIAVLADPVFGELAQPLAMAGSAEVFRSWTSTLSPLPATAREAEALGNFYAEDERLILTGAAATATSFFSSEVRNARIIHLATHGYFNEQLPELIGFALSGGDGDDGFVSMAEISTQYFNADLVVISACSTAQGEIVPGEGALSLGRTFLAQGVNSVISTLWPVSDRATALFMERFYEAVNTGGATYAEALTQAQQLLRESDTYRAPAYWAAYTLTTASAAR